ncbi:MAG: efflux RND transporter permease subunit [Pseudomonadota bacterium]
MTGIIDAAINRWRTTLLIMLMVVFAGVVARQSISVESDPYIQVPFYIVNVYHEGISPEDAERLLVMPMEQELKSLDGLKELKGYASEGIATMLVEFDADEDLDQALVDVREAIDRAKAEMPSTIEEPIINEESTADFPILQVNLSGADVPERVLFEAARSLKQDIEGIPGVLTAELEGAREEQLEAVIDPVKLEAYNISNQQLIDTVLRNNRLIPAGALDTGEGRFSVKVPSVIERATDVFDLPVKTTGDTVVTLRDVATVRRTFKDRSGYARINGKRGISIAIHKRAKANTIDTSNQVRATVERLRPDIPAAVDIFYTSDQAPFALSQVTELEGNIATALALVMVLVVAAMGFRTGVIVGIGIPVSFLFSLIFIYLLGYSFNFMVMFGMLLGLGMLIDGAIVVTEYADRKMMEGFEPRSAYSLAAKRMFWPVAASVATTLAAFLPLMFWPGVSGKFMRYLPVTVFTVLSGSLVYALVFCPMLGSLFGKAEAKSKTHAANLAELENGDPTRLRNLTGMYARVLAVATRFAPVTMLLTVGVLFASFWAYGQYGKGMVFFSDADPQYAQVNVLSRGNLSVEEANLLVRDVERSILDIAGIEAINTYVRTPGSNPRALDKIGTVFMEMHSQSERLRSTRAILEDVRVNAAQPGIDIEVIEMEQGPPVGKPISIQFASKERSLLEPAVAKVRAYMDTLPGLRDISDSRSLPGIEWEISVDRAQASLYGADVSQVGVAVQLVTNGVKVGEYRPNDAEDPLDIRVRYPSSARGIGALDDLRISTPKGQVPISNFVERIASPNVDTTERIDGVPVESVRSNVAPDVLASDMVRELEAWIASQDWDPRLSISFRGENEEQDAALGFVGFAFSMSLLLMFILLVTQFNALYQSALILFAVVLSTAGVLLGLLITDSSFSAILTGVGVVALAGIVVNNNIVLIDTYNHLRREHPELDYVTLITRTGAQRLRPVALTTITTVFGLLPLASNYSIDFINRSIVYGGQLSSFWVPLSQAIVSGLTFATLLTLVATPAMLALPEQCRQLWGNRVAAPARSAWQRRRSEAPEIA